MRFLVFGILLVATLKAAYCLGKGSPQGVYVGGVPGKTYMSVKATFGKYLSKLKVNVLVICGEGRVKKEVSLPLKKVDDNVFSVEDYTKSTDLIHLRKFIGQNCGHEENKETLAFYEFENENTRCVVRVGNDNEVYLYKT
ncbi:hypothetical protein FOL47_010614 [Perkinsus chesapeaki]|uniref:Uncharacterized protein n=1 Tax=Perkinsus chesapeaki TaxID=330153 RepID=A0A7J6L102_PERCH|nr:hypothetical protein FOL47_010614 [Perkinsus chesapeaki]